MQGTDQKYGLGDQPRYLPISHLLFFLPPLVRIGGDVQSNIDCMIYFRFVGLSPILASERFTNRIECIEGQGSSLHGDHIFTP